MRARAPTGRRPYWGRQLFFLNIGGIQIGFLGEEHNAVEMVGHDDERVDVDGGIGGGDFVPGALDHFAGGIAVLDAVRNACRTGAVLPWVQMVTT